MPRFLPVCLLFVFLAAPAASGTAQVGDFRIKSVVYRGGEEDLEPLARSVTLFHGEKIFDFSLGDEPETAILDLAARQFVLINFRDGTVTTFDAELLDEFLADQNQRAKEIPSPLVQFLAEPKFGETFNSQEHRLTLTSPIATYRVRGEVPEDPSLVARYAEFADWYAKVNATRPGAFPAAARLSLNAAIAAHGLIPLEVRFDFQDDDGQAVTLHSTHEYQWELDETDLEQIETALDQVGSRR